MPRVKIALPRTTIDQAETVALLWGHDDPQIVIVAAVDRLAREQIAKSRAKLDIIAGNRPKDEPA